MGEALFNSWLMMVVKSSFVHHSFVMQLFWAKFSSENLFLIIRKIDYLWQRLSGCGDLRIKLKCHNAELACCKSKLMLLEVVHCGKRTKLHQTVVRKHSLENSQKSEELKFLQMSCFCRKTEKLNGCKMKEKGFSAFV